tara:strand:- start:1313 stop:2020 length:708 start_codon:yes stop_codon:yes gene_type:complete
MNVKLWVYLLFVLSIIWLLYYLNETSIQTHTLDLNRHGIVKIGATNSSNDVLKHLPNGYVFLKYKYAIKGCSLSTFHRDVTSSQYEYKTKHPVYTFIVYHNTGPHLTVCPGSHNTTPFLWSRGKTICGKKGDGYLFNCDLVHAGAKNIYGDERFVEQYKIVHVDDLLKLKNLWGLYTNKVGDCNISTLYEMFTRKFSLLFSYPVNHVFTRYAQSDQKSTFGNFILWMYGRRFYNS